MSPPPAPDLARGSVPRRRTRVAAISAAVAAVPVVGIALVMVLGGASGNAPAPDGEAGDAQPITVTATGCGAGWSLGTSGAAAFAITNRADRSTEITLRSAADDAIVAEIERLPAQGTRQLSVVVNPGSYYWMCQFRGASDVRSQAVTVTGPSVPVAKPLLEVTADDMKEPLARYRAYVSGQLATLKTQTAVLRQDLAAGDAGRAKADWVAGHRTYHLIGAAYDAFGELGDGIDGLAQGLEGGVSDPDFTGFHKIEKLLWSGADPRTLVPAASALTAAVAALETRMPSFTFDPNDISLRTHEILEGTARFQLTGADDYGSGTSLATADADIDGTRTLVRILAPLLQSRSAGLPARLTGQLDVLQRAVRATAPGGRWVPVKNIGSAQRQQINAAAGAVLETLSVVPDMLEVRG